MTSGIIAITTSYTPLAFLYALVRTTIEIDGEAERRPWGTHHFEVAPGEHTIAISYPWLFDRRCGRNTVTVSVQAGATTHVAYRAGAIRFLPGRITLEDPIPTARVIKAP